MFSAISSTIFAYRNVGKAEKGEIGRVPVAAAQMLGVTNEVAHYNSKIAKGADAALSVFKNLAKESKLVDKAIKVTKWGVNNVNPLICISGGLKVAMSDDKTSTAIKEAAALSTMFAGEAIAKQVLPKLVKSIPVGNRVGAIIKGLGFVGASIASYALGEMLGKNLSEEIKVNSGIKSTKKIDQMA